MTNHKKTIGILGGMGPLASATLYHSLVTLAQQQYQAKQDTDFPPMLLYSLPLEGFDETGIADLLKVKNQLIIGVKKLESAGSDFIIIACNTVHYFYQSLQQQVKVPILNLIKETAQTAANAGCDQIGLLSSASTAFLGLYQNEFNKFKIKTLLVTLEQQRIINDIILKVMSGLQDQKDKKNLQTIIENLRQQGAKGIVLGCTELPLVISQADLNLPLFNSLEIIAKAALQHAYE